MEKIASQMLDKLQEWVKENPELVKTTLLTSGLGAAAAAALTGKESEHERTSTRVKRRIRNALFGALAAGGSVGLLHYAGKNLSTAKLKNAPTPEEKFDNTVNTIGNALMHPLALTGAGAYGAKKGLFLSLDKTNNRAARLTKSIISDIDNYNASASNTINNTINNAVNNAVNNVVNNAANNAVANAANNVNANTIANAVINAVNNSNANVTLLDNLQGALGKDPKDVSDAAKILKNDFNADAVRAYVNTLEPNSKKNMYKLLREAGFDFAEKAPGTMKTGEKLLAKLKGLGRRNWRAGAGAALGTGAIAGLGAIISNLSED